MQLDGRMKKYWLPWLVGTKHFHFIKQILSCIVNTSSCFVIIDLGMPSETAAAICSLLMGRVLEQFPKLKVVFAHGGGAFPYLIGRIAHGHDVRPDLCATENPYTPR